MPRKAQQIIFPIDTTMDTLTATVFSNKRTIQAPNLKLPKELKANTRLKMDGLKFLSLLPENAVPVAFLDPQYRGILDKLNYGNEGEKRGQRRCTLEQMSVDVIKKFIREIARTLIPSGHLFLWMDKFHLCQDFKIWFDGTAFDVVDLVCWDKGKIGMGYRSRRTTEFCAVLQKQPRKAKGVWKNHNIPDMWRERVVNGDHTHTKPRDLQGELMAAVSNEGDFVIDPAAGSFSVMEAAKIRRRTFLGCDLNG